MTYEELQQEVERLKKARAIEAESMLRMSEATKAAREKHSEAYKRHIDAINESKKELECLRHHNESLRSIIIAMVFASVAIAILTTVYITTL